MFHYTIFATLMRDIARVPEIVDDNIEELEKEVDAINQQIDLETKLNTPISRMSIVKLRGRLSLINSRLRKYKLVLTNIERASKIISV